MARRTVWLLTGVVAGAASSLYAERKLRQTLEVASARLAPEALVSEVGRTARQAARSTGGRVRDAVTTGRTEMQRREQEIWAGLSAPVPGDAAAPDHRPLRPERTPVSGTAGATRSPDRTRVRRRSRRSTSQLGR